MYQNWQYTWNFGCFAKIMTHVFVSSIGQVVVGLLFQYPFIWYLLKVRAAVLDVGPKITPLLHILHHILSQKSATQKIFVISSRYQLNSKVHPSWAWFSAYISELLAMMYGWVFEAVGWPVPYSKSKFHLLRRPILIHHQNERLCECLRASVGPCHRGGGKSKFHSSWKAPKAHAYPPPKWRGWVSVWGRRLARAMVSVAVARQVASRQPSTATVTATEAPSACSGFLSVNPQRLSKGGVHW